LCFYYKWHNPSIYYREGKIFLKDGNAVCNFYSIPILQFLGFVLSAITILDRIILKDVLKAIVFLKQLSYTWCFLILSYRGVESYYPPKR
jgi:hypothetical protein